MAASSVREESIDLDRWSVDGEPGVGLVRGRQNELTGDLRCDHCGAISKRIWDLDHDDGCPLGDR